MNAESEHLGADYYEHGIGSADPHKIRFSKTFGSTHGTLSSPYFLKSESDFKKRTLRATSNTKSFINKNTIVTNKRSVYDPNMCSSINDEKLNETYDDEININFSDSSSIENTDSESHDTSINNNHKNKNSNNDINSNKNSNTSNRIKNIEDITNNDNSNTKSSKFNNNKKENIDSSSNIRNGNDDISNINIDRKNSDSRLTKHQKVTTENMRCITLFSRSKGIDNFGFIFGHSTNTQKRRRSNSTVSNSTAGRTDSSINIFNPETTTDSSLNETAAIQVVTKNDDTRETELIHQHRQEDYHSKQLDK